MALRLAFFTSLIQFPESLSGPSLRLQDDDTQTVLEDVPSAASLKASVATLERTFKRH